MFNLNATVGHDVVSDDSSELKNKPIARKSIAASRAIRPGDIFSSDSITTKRPGTGVSPMRWDEVIGRRAKREFAVDELIELASCR
jgi:sialic acid synthase SpsE